MNKIDKRIGKHMGLGLVSAGFLFFFLPDFTVLDLLPDLIGYFLIYCGLTRLGDLYEEIRDTKKMFYRLIILGVAKLLSVFLVFGVSDGADRPTTILIVMFVLAVAEAILLIPAYIKLFDGLTYIGTRENGVAVFEKPKAKKKKKRSYTDLIKRSTIIFVILKNLFAVFPESMSLSVSDSIDSYSYSRYDFINYFRVLSILTVLVLGIIWILKIRKYFSALKKDTPFIERLEERYRNEILGNETIFIKRRIKNGFLLMALGAVLLLDVYVNGNAGYNIIPDVFAAFCFLSAALIIGEKKSVYRQMTVFSSAVYGAITTFSYCYNYYFNLDYHPLNVSRKVQAYNRWSVLLTVSAAEMICFIIMVLSLSMLIYSVVKNHCGYVPIHASIDPVAKSKAIYGRLKKYICAAAALGCFAGFAIFFRVFSFTVNSIAEWSWMIELAFEIAFAVTFILALLRINEEVEEKYQFS